MALRSIAISKSRLDTRLREYSTKVAKGNALARASQLHSKKLEAGNPPLLTNNSTPAESRANQGNSAAAKSVVSPVKVAEPFLTSNSTPAKPNSNQKTPAVFGGLVSSVKLLKSLNSISIPKSAKSTANHKTTIPDWEFIPSVGLPEVPETEASSLAKSVRYVYIVLEANELH